MFRYLIVLLLAPVLLFSAPLDVRHDGLTKKTMVAAIQFEPRAGDPGKDRARIRELVQQAAGRGARFVVLPELVLAGPLGAERVLKPESIPGPTVDFFADLSRALNIWIAFGVPEDDSRGGFYSSVVLTSSTGKVEWVRRKVIARPETEEGKVTRGDFRAIQEAVDASGVRVGVVAGDDIRLDIARLAERGVDLVLVAADWSAEDAPDRMRLCQDFADQNKITIAVANRREGSSGGGVFIPGAKPSPVVAQITTAGVEISRKKSSPASLLGLPPVVPEPIGTPGTPELAQLGAMLFFDTNLSSNGKVSCGSCHQPAKAFSNGAAKGVGVSGSPTKRNVPSLWNVAFRPVLQWDGYASSLENFCKYPITSVAEMNFHYLDDVPAYVNANPVYVEGFRRTLHVERMEFSDVARALAAYMRTLVSGNSAFDRYYYGGDQHSLSASAKRGLDLFTGKAGCEHCHRIGERYALFFDYKFHVLGVGYNATTGRFNDIGLAGISTDDQKGLFLTPSLRNVAETAPYMHDGSIATLEDVIEFYDRGAVPNPQLDPAIHPLHLTAQEKQDLLSFLRSLTGRQEDPLAPTTPIYKETSHARR